MRSGSTTRRLPQRKSDLRQTDFVDRDRGVNTLDRDLIDEADITYVRGVGEPLIADEILQIDLEVETTKQKAVSAQSLTDSLTTFGDLYQEALPEEKRELIRLRVNQLVWTPEEIKLALLGGPQACQRLGESQQLVARTGFEPVLPP